MEFLIPILLSVFGGMAQQAMRGGTDATRQTQTSTTKQTALPRGYQSPLLGLFDNAAGSAMLGNLMRLGNAGYPSGVVNQGMSGIPGLLALLKQMQPDLLAAASKSTPPNEQTKGASNRGGR